MRDQLNERIPETCHERQFESSGIMIHCLFVFLERERAFRMLENILDGGWLRSPRGWCFGFGVAADNRWAPLDGYARNIAQTRTTTLWKVSGPGGGDGGEEKEMRATSQARLLWSRMASIM